MEQRSILIIGLIAILSAGFMGWRLGQESRLSDQGDEGTSTIEEDADTITKPTSGSTTKTPTKPPTSTTKPTVPQIPQVGTSVKGEVTVRYLNTGFSPQSTVIKQGEAVKFVNESSKALRVMSDPHSYHTNYLGFEQGSTVGKGGSFSFIFTRSGTWGYHNESFISHTGSILVTPQTP